MRPASLGVVGQDDVTSMQVVLQGLHLKPDGVLHGAEVNGNVRRVGNEAAGVIEEGAAEVEPLLDVGGDGGSLKNAAHLFCDGHEPVREDRELNGVQLGADFSSQVVADVDANVALTGDLEPAVRLHQDGAQLVHHYARTDCGVA